MSVLTCEGNYSENAGTQRWVAGQLSPASGAAVITSLRESASDR